MKKCICLIISLMCISHLIWGMELSKKSISKKQKNKTGIIINLTHTFIPESEIPRIRSIAMSDNGTFAAVSSQTVCSCERELQVIRMPIDTCIFREKLPRLSGDNDPTSFPDRAHLFLREDGRQVGIAHDNKAHIFDTLFDREIFELELHDGSYSHAVQNKNLLACVVERMIYEPGAISSMLQMTSYHDGNLPGITTLSYKLPYKSLRLVDRENHVASCIDLKKRLAVRSLCFDPSGAFLAVAADKRAEIYKTDTLERVLCVMPYKSHVSSVSFNHDGTLFAVASEKKIRVFTLDGKLVTCIYDKERKPGSPDNPYPNISFIGKNSLIALRTVNDVHLFNLKGECLFSLSKHTDIPIDFKTITCFNKKKPNMLVATDSELRMVKFSDFVAI